MSGEKLMVEKFHQSLAAIKPCLQKALEITGLSDTSSICGEVNFAVALKLSHDLAIPIRKYSQETAKEFANNTPAIGLIEGEIETPLGRRLHSYPIVFGVESTPVLVDGANDQIDPQTPFLISRLGKNNYQSVIDSLNKKSHFGHEESKPMKDQLKKLYARTRIFFLEMLEEGLFNPEEVLVLAKQFEFEYDAGATNMIYGPKRPLITFFSKQLGINYPYVHDPHLYLLANFDISSRINNDQLKEKQREIMNVIERLFEEGQI